MLHAVLPVSALNVNVEKASSLCVEGEEDKWNKDFDAFSPKVGYPQILGHFSQSRSG